MARETWVQSQIESYQRLKKWYLMPPCLKLSIIRYGSRVKWSNPGKGVAPFPTPWCSSYRIGSLRVTLDYGRQKILSTFEHVNMLEPGMLIFMGRKAFSLLRILPKYYKLLAYKCHLKKKNALMLSWFKF